MIVTTLGTPALGTPAPTSARQRAASAGFSMPAPTGRPAGPAPAAPTSVLDCVLALQEQEQDSAATRDRNARKHGQALLQALAGLQQALLGGGDEAASLHRLANLAATATAASDPALTATVGALALRAKVELARRGL